MINARNNNDLYDQEVVRAYRRLIRSMRDTTRTEKKTIRRAFDMAYEAHSSMRRKSGEPYILHPLAVARIVVSEMGLEDTTSVVCALLHDVVEDTEIELADIRHLFGNKAAEIIDGLTKISTSPTVDGQSMYSTQAETFRKILLTISHDIRVILIKLADRLHNMRTLGAMREEKMLKITSETLYIYAPLAHRLGLYEIKSELEDLSFKYSQPQTYQQISDKLAARKEAAQLYIDNFIKLIRQALRNSGLKFMVKSRFKTTYSIYSKMIRKNLPFEEVYDIYAVRIILESRGNNREREDCWYVYSILSGLFRPNPKRLRDWITVPKENGYESLHTTLMGPEGQWVEVQIRTTRMDDIAEKGIAAHWKYKDDGEAQDEFLTEWIAHIREILHNPDLNALEAVREFRENLTPQDVYAFTPKGELMRLPFHSTVLDFAYKIHTNIGDTAIGAKVNTHVVTLDTEVRPGDQVEIITSKRQSPKQEWLRFVKTPKAKESIRNALRRKRRELIEQGRMLFHWRARQYGINEDHPYMKELLAFFFIATKEEFFYRLGSRQIETQKIVDFIKLKKEGKEVGTQQWEQNGHNGSQESDEALTQLGMDPDMLVLGKDVNIDQTALATCCNPIPGDEILAFDDGERVYIHRSSCQEAIRLMSQHGSNIIKAKWQDKSSSQVEFLTAIQVRGIDKQGMLNDLIRIISLRMKLNIRAVTIESEDGMFEGLFKLYVRSSDELAKLIENVKSLENVYTVARIDTNQEPNTAQV